MRALGRAQAPLAAGVAFAAYGVFGTLPILLGLGLALGLDEEATTAWVFAVFVINGAATIPLVLARREPLPIGWNVPAGILLGAAGVRYGWDALLGASLVAGLVIAAGGLAGLGRASLRFLPLPIVMAMFAGSILRLATDAFAQLGGAEPLLAAAAIGGYFVTRLVFRDAVPPTVGAIAASLAAVAVAGRFPADVPFALTGPRFATIAFDPAAIATLVVPIVLLVVGTGNVQALGFLRAQGYRPSADRLTLLVGALTTLSAGLGGSPSGLARVGAAITGGADAGDRRDRWIASLFAGAIFVAVGLLAVPVAALSFQLPRGLVTTVAGLAVVTALLEALRVAFTSRLSYSAFFALIIAFAPFAPFGLESAFWSLVAGMALALLFERDALREELRRADI